MKKNLLILTNENNKRNNLTESNFRDLSKLHHYNFRTPGTLKPNQCSRTSATRPSKAHECHDKDSYSKSIFLTTLSDIRQNV